MIFAGSHVTVLECCQQGLSSAPRPSERRDNRSDVKAKSQNYRSVQGQSRLSSSNQVSEEPFFVHLNQSLPQKTKKATR